MSGFVISHVQSIALDFNSLRFFNNNTRICTRTLQKQPFFVKFGANTNKINNFTAPFGAVFLYPKIIYSERCGRWNAVGGERTET